MVRGKKERFETLGRPHVTFSGEGTKCFMGIFEVITAMLLKFKLFWDMTLCYSVSRHVCFEGSKWL
jgi:hypothetical protein